MVDISETGTLPALACACTHARTHTHTRLTAITALSQGLNSELVFTRELHPSRRELW
uniref:Uncharacterized protein n=1 Tax=Anguilla anguilla TaxID=7936 RepID=A0A0E9WNG6_ANGAN